MAAKLVKLLRHCESQLDDSRRKGLAWYEERPRRVSALVLFEAYAWALLVTGMSRKAADTWAANTGFWEVFTLKNCASKPANELIRRVQVSPDTVRAKKLRAIHTLGRSVARKTPTEVAGRYLMGEARTARLSSKHIQLLDALPYVGETNARFMIRNMGGEAIKDDRWIAEVMRCFGCNLHDLADAGKELGWKAGRLDLVLWLYCEQEIRVTKAARQHFRSLGLLRK